jgi:hypothetical protein
MDQLKVTVHRAITYPVFWKEGVQIPTHSPDTKTQFVQAAVSGRENVEVVSGVRWLHYTSTTAGNPELIILPIDMCNLCDRRRYASGNRNNNNNNNNNNNSNKFTDQTVQNTAMLCTSIPHSVCIKLPFKLTNVIYTKQIRTQVK